MEIRFQARFYSTTCAVSGVGKVKQPWAECASVFGLWELNELYVKHEREYLSLAETPVVNCRRENTNGVRVMSCTNWSLCAYRAQMARRISLGWIPPGTRWRYVISISRAPRLLRR